MCPVLKGLSVVFLNRNVSLYFELHEHDVIVAELAISRLWFSVTL